MPAVRVLGVEHDLYMNTGFFFPDSSSEQCDDTGVGHGWQLLQLFPSKY